MAIEPVVGAIARISVDANGTLGNDASSAPVFSPDGTRVAFQSNASNLVPGDTNGKYDIFVKILATGAIARISVSASGLQGDNNSFSPVFSSDGTRIAFQSDASNLVAGDTNQKTDSFVADLATGAVVRVSVAAGGAQGNGQSTSPSFSPNGNQVVFTSSASNLVAGDTNDEFDVFVRDLATGAITRVNTDSKGAQGSGSASGIAYAPVFSPDGTRVAFQSFASNLVPGDTNSRSDIFVKTLATGAITRVSTGAGGVEGNGNSLAPVFSPDGTRVAFHSRATNLVPGDTNAVDDIFVKDLVTGTVTRVSTDADGVQGDATSSEPVFSPDGARIAFRSNASNLVAGDTNETTDIFIKDLATGAITRVSTDSNGVQGNSVSTAAAFSADGTRLAFRSAASNLVPGDTNFNYDVYVKTIAAAPYALAATDAVKTEGHGGSTGFVFTVTRAGGASAVNWAVAGSGAAPASAADFVGGILPSGTVSFAAGETSKTLTILVAGDSAVEANEGFTVTLSSAGGAALATADGTIVNDDAALSIAALSATKPEGSVGTTPYTFTVTRSGDTSGANSASWAVAGDGAAPAAASDFAGGTFPTGTVSFAAGETSKVVTVNVAADAVGELTERFSVTLANPSAGTAIGTASAVGVIANDDTSLSIAAASGDRAEGTNAGTTGFAFLVSRSGDLTKAATVNWAAAGTGASPATATDFLGNALPSGILSFAVGETSKLITLNVLADSVVEAHEQVRVSLTGATGASIATASAIRTILNDDIAIPALSIAAASGDKVEGTGAGTTGFSFLVTRSGDLTKASTVNWAASGTGPNPVNAADFQGNVLPTGTLSFAPGEGVKLVTLNALADAGVEANEAVQVTLSAATGATIATPSAIRTILNDDTALTIAAASGDKAEGTGAGTTGFSFIVARTGNLAQATTVKWTASGAGANPVNAADFQGAILPSGVVSFAIGETAKLVTLNALADATVEANEAVQVTLSGATGATIATASAVRTILNDDAALSIAAASGDKAEGTGASTGFAYVVTRSGDVSKTATVNWAASGAGANPANAADFAGGVLPAGSLSFAAGEVTKLVTLAINGDTAPEASEQVQVTLAGATGATIATASATRTILNDDAIVSTAASETLTGTDSPDIFRLGGGLDVVSAKAGLDVFQFLPGALGAAAGNASTIEDLNRALGEKLDLSAIDANAIGGLANDAFSFIGTAAFNGTPGQLRWEDQGSVRMIQGNVNADTTADLTIFVKAAGPIDGGWFTL